MPLALARSRDLRTLGRGALAAAVHPCGAGFERAWLLEWNVRSGLLTGCDAVVAPASAPPLGAWLEARMAPRLEVEARPGVLALRPHRLGAVAEQAWGGAAGTVEPEAGAPWAGASHVGAAVLRRTATPWALVVGVWSAAPEQRQRDALEATAALCSRLAQGLDEQNEARRRAQQAAGLARAVRAAGSAQNLAEVLRRVVRIAAQVTQARGGALWRVAAGGPTLEVAQGSPAGGERAAHGLRDLARAVAEDGKRRVVDRAVDQRGLEPGVAAAVDCVVVVPVRAYGRVLGALACYDHGASHASDPAGFPAADVEFLSALADVAGLAVDQADRFAESRRGEQQRRELAARLDRQERLAWLGELAGRMVQEARNPLASIAAFARRAQRELAEGDPGREYLEIILREAGRLERLLTEQRDYAASAEVGMKVESLNAAVQEALAASAEVLVRRRVRLVRRLAPDLPALLLDRERIRRAVANMLESALEAAGVGGRIRIETRRLGAAVVLELSHDGPRTPGGLLEEVFVPFVGGRGSGPSVGLGVAQQIVREHGGEVRVRSDGEWATIFCLSLPVHENEDRRRAGPERRRARADRRAPPRLDRTG